LEQAGLSKAEAPIILGRAENHDESDAGVLAGSQAFTDQLSAYPASLKFRTHGKRGESDSCRMRRPHDLYRAKSDVTGNHPIDLRYQRKEKPLMSAQTVDKLRFLIRGDRAPKHVANCSGVVGSLWANESVQ
jgi:hypothetical protein